MKLRNLSIQSNAKAGTHILLGLLCICFASGFLGGWLLYCAIVPGSAFALSGYLQEYAQMASGVTDVSVSLFQAAIIYFRYPVVLFLLAYSSIGIYLAPALCFMQGATLSFAVSCFVGEMGRLGVQLAFVAFGIRCLFLLPCCLYLGMLAIRRSAIELPRKAAGKRLYTPNSTMLQPAMLVFGILLLGVFVEITLVPQLFLRLLPPIT